MTSDPKFPTDLIHGYLRLAWSELVIERYDCVLRPLSQFGDDFRWVRVGGPTRAEVLTDPKSGWGTVDLSLYFRVRAGQSDNTLTWSAGFVSPPGAGRVGKSVLLEVAGKREVHWSHAPDLLRCFDMIRTAEAQNG